MTRFRRLVPGCEFCAFYGLDIIDQFRRATGYVDGILNDENPADLPTDALAINLRHVSEVPALHACVGYRHLVAIELS